MIDQESLSSIENLHRLKTDGLITEDEYEKAKQRLLFGTKPQRATGLQAGPITTPLTDDHLGWITLPLKRYADFTGRSSRKEFWMFQLTYVALLIVAIMSVGGLNSDGEMSSLGKMTLLMVFLAILGLVVPLIACEARRFHDQDRSAWLVLLNFIPYIGPVIVLGMMLIEGTRGENQFGPDPKQG